MPKELTTFDQVLIAIKQGKKAQRAGWNVNSHHIEGHKDGKGKVIGMVMSLNGVVGAAALHNNDILADDWEIFD